MKKPLLLVLAIAALGGVYYFNANQNLDFGKAQLVETAPLSHTSCKADLDYPSSNGYSESYTRPNKCHSQRVFYKYANYYATGNCGAAAWCNIRVRCPAGSIIQTHNSGGGWHYSMSPNIDGAYDGPSHYFCVDTNGNQTAPIPGESEQYPNHSHSINLTKVALQKVEVVNENKAYYQAIHYNKLSFMGGWVNCPDGVLGPYPGSTSSLDIDYENFPNHFHCKNGQQNLANTSDADDDPEARPLPMSPTPSYDLSGAGFGSSADTTTPRDQFIDKNTNMGISPLGTVRCVHTNSDKVYYSTTGTCPAASQFPISSCSVITLTLANNKSSYIKGEFVEFTYSCSPAGTRAPVTTVQLVKPDGSPTNYLNSGILDTASLTLALNTYNLTPGPYNLQVCIHEVCSPDSIMASQQITVTAVPGTSDPTTNSNDPSLLGYWKFDNSIKNEITGSPDAVSVGSPRFVAVGGRADGGYVSLPTANDYLKIPYSSIFDLPDTFTIEFWFRQRNSQSFLQDLIKKGTPPNRFNFYIFRQLNDQNNKGPVITGYTARDTGYWTQTSNGNDLAHEVWHQVVFVKYLSGRAYYLDGVLTHKDDTSSPVALTPAEPIIIGGGKTVDTDFDNLKIYNRALTEAEVRQNGGFPPPPPPPTPTPTPTPTDDFSIKHAGCDTMFLYRKNSAGQYINEQGQIAPALPPARAGYVNEFKLIDDHYHICETSLSGQGNTGSGSITVVPPSNDFDTKHAGCDMTLYRKNSSDQYIDERGQLAPALTSRPGYVSQFRFVDDHYHICETALSTQGNTSSGSTTVTPSTTPVVPVGTTTVTPPSSMPTATPPSATTVTPGTVSNNPESNQPPPPPPVDLPVENIPPISTEISAAIECNKIFIKNVSNTLKSDKQLLKDLRRQLDESQGYPRSNEVEDVINNTYQSLVALDKLIKSKLTPQVCENAKEQLNQLHEEYLSQFSDYHEEMSEFKEQSNCQRKLTAYADKLENIFDKAKDENKKADIQNLFDQIGDKIQELGQEHDFAYDPVYECLNFIEEVSPQIDQIEITSDDDIARIVDTILADKLQPVFQKLEQQLENSGKTLDRVMVQVANLHKSLETLSVVATSFTEKITTSYTALSLIEEKFAAQKIEIQTAKDRLIPLVDSVTKAIKDSNCVQGEQRNQVINVISDIASINWLSQDAAQVEAKLNNFLVACAARELQSETIAEFVNSTNESSTENQEESYKLGLTPYPDVPTHVWYYGGMLSMSKNGIMKQGRPAEPVLRQDALLTVLRFSGFGAETEPNRDCTLKTDSPVAKVSDYALCAIEVGLRERLLLGGDMTQPIQRGEIANWIATLNMVPTLNPERISEIQKSYKDLQTAVPNDWIAAISRLADVKVMVGQVSETQKNWQPFDNLNRASLSVVLDHLLGLKSSENN